MAVFRVHKTKDFTVMSNHHLRDKNLTLKAKGLLSVILSLPDDWKYSIAGLSAICKEGTSAVKSALQELTDTGYVTVTKLYPNQTETGRIEYVYDIHETPQAPRKQGVENLPLESQQVENQGQLNTDVPSTDKPNTKDKTKKERKKPFVPPTVEEIRDYVKENGFIFDADEFFAYYASQGWRKANGQKVVSWKQCCVTWERREQKNSKGGKRKPTQQKLEISEPRIGSMKIDNKTGKTEVYKGNGVWEDYVSDYVPQEGDVDIEF
jgi:hypothetical protein